VRLLRIQFTVLAAVSVLALPAGAGAQQAASDKPVLAMKVEAREVLLPVTTSVRTTLR
jgi:hypothetical protein